MTADAGEGVLRRYVAAVYNAGDLAVVDALVAPDFAIAEPRAGDPVHGRAGLKDLIRALRTVFPDLHVRIEELSRQSAEKIIARMTVSGAYDPPQTGLAVFLIRDGQIAVDTAAEDLLARLYHVRGEAAARGDAATAEGERPPAQ